MTSQDLSKPTTANGQRLATRRFETDPAFDGLTAAAAAGCNAPAAMLFVVAGDRQRLKSNYPHSDLAHAFQPAETAIGTSEFMVIEDANADPRSANYPIIGASGMRFYAAVPLISVDRRIVGQLCVMDPAPRGLSDSEQRVIEEIARVAVTVIEIRDDEVRSLAAADLAQDRVNVIFRETPVMLTSIDINGILLDASDVLLTNLGYTREEIIGKPWPALMTPESRKYASEVALPAFFRVGHYDNIEYQIIRKDGGLLDVSVSAFIQPEINGQTRRSFGIVQDITSRRETERQLVENRDHLMNVIEGANIGTWEWNVENDDLRINEKFAEIIGYSYDELQPMTIAKVRDLGHPDDVIASDEEFVAHLTGKQDYYEVEVRIRHKQGHWVWVLNRGRVTSRNSDGRVTRVSGTETLIDKRKRAEQELSESRELLQVTLESIGDGVVTADLDGNIRWMNSVAEQLTGWTLDHAGDRPIESVFKTIHEGSGEPLKSAILECLEQGSTTSRLDSTVIISRLGKQTAVQESASPIRDRNENILGAVLVFRDITEQRRLTREIRYRASHDSLTGLFNRTEFEDRLHGVLTSAKENGSTHALMYVDLDEFKIVNDSCGHAAGDDLLQRISTLFGESVRLHDTVARLGGDEFGVILEDCTIGPARRIAQQICDRIGEYRFEHEGQRFRIGSSIGLVPIDDSWDGTAAVLKAADAACYAAKESGRDRVHLWQGTDQIILARQGEMRWTQRIEQALDEDQFVLFAQRITPVQAASSGIHCEILVRLLDADGSIVPPIAFLPAAERFHLASRIDRWVVQAVLNWLVGIGDEVRKFDTVAINLSGQSIVDKSFHRFLEEKLSESPIDVSKLCFEITETAAITRLSEASEFIERMKEYNVRTALDDFGAGASSFGYLKSLRVDYLKIDGQFVRGLTTDALDMATVQCFVDVAKVVGIKTIAEFVEDNETVAGLRKIGVDYAQGYFFHRPSPIGELVAESPSSDAPS